MDSAHTWVTVVSLLVLAGFFYRFLTVLYRNGTVAQSDIMIVRRVSFLPLSVLVLILGLVLLLLGFLSTEHQGTLLLAIAPVVSLCCIWTLERGVAALRHDRTTPNESRTP